MAHRRVLKHPCPSMESASRPFGSHFRHFTGSNAKNGPLGLGLALACTYRGGPSLYLIPLLTSLPKLSTRSFISDVTGLATSTIKRKGLRHDVALPYRVSAKGKLASKGSWLWSSPAYNYYVIINNLAISLVLTTFW